MGKTDMGTIAHSTARLILAAKRAYRRKIPFLVAFAVVFAVTFVAFDAFGFVPDAPVVAKVSAANTASLVADALPAVSLSTSELPVKLAIPDIDLTVSVADPTSTDVSALDALLLRGAVRYPTSGQLGEQNANVVIFGHSSYLPVVRNQAYKTFDGIQKLKVDDLITVYSSDMAYTYAVQTVQEESANSAAIPLDVSGEVLTLSTCDSFATPSDRFVVTANFVSSHPITAS